ncbi:hypothetical protein SLEP1_g38781 [Rubroshorea leprosula]|uniref:Uncharacterized protein n=1 Tax=Rubroshorea leprosula TaxID=152421 RepID=A0AAV5KZ70_9ROSI|nr:hypothetical protein SLEP1_g38781 [Rubroshorea leprosula]
MANSKFAVFGEWSKKVVEVLKGGLVVENGNGAVESDVKSVESDDDGDDGGRGGDEEIVDLEDIAGKGPSRKSVNAAESNGKVNGKRDMVTPVIRATLEKQGIKLLVHIAVLKFVDGPSLNFAAKEVATSIHFME